jgi:hypothetical protein
MTPPPTPAHPSSQASDAHSSHLIAPLMAQSRLSLQGE